MQTLPDWCLSTVSFHLATFNACYRGQYLTLENVWSGLNLEEDARGVTVVLTASSNTSWGTQQCLFLNYFFTKWWQQAHLTICNALTANLHSSKACPHEKSKINSVKMPQSSLQSVPGDRQQFLAPSPHRTRGWETVQLWDTTDRINTWDREMWMQCWGKAAT